MIAAPGFVGSKVMKMNSSILKRHAVAGEMGADLLFHLFVPDIDMDLLTLDELSDKCGVNRRDILVTIWKADAIRPWPCEPGGDVTVPLGWHPESETGG